MSAAVSRPPRDVAERALPIHLRTVMSSTGAETTPFVSCPKRGETIDARECASCMRMRSLEWEPGRGGEVRCYLSNQPAPPDPRADIAELAARTRVRDVVAPTVTCVTPDVTLERLRAHFGSTHERAVAVVDAEGKLEGLVSRSDLVRAPEEGTAADVMTARVHALPEDAPLSFVVALLAQEDVGEAPIVRADGAVTGICHALDVMRWLAARLGYVWPGR